MAVADEERAALVQAFRNDIQNTRSLPSLRFAAGLFREKRHRVALHTADAEVFPRMAGGVAEIDAACGCGGNRPPESQCNVRYKGDLLNYPLPAEFDVLLHPFGNLM